jgi:hypothetical protein
VGRQRLAPGATSAGPPGWRRRIRATHLPLGTSPAAVRSADGIIDEAEFVAAIDDAMAALEKNDIGQTEREEVLSFLYGLTGEVVHV